MTTTYRNTKEPVDRIVAMQFGVLSPDDIRRHSVVPIITPELYDGATPKPGGLFDPRMGVLHRDMRCPTDERGHIDCPGYFGHLDLALPVLHYQYIKWIIKILRCVCPMCSYPRFNMNNRAHRQYLMSTTRDTRLDRAVEISGKHKICDRCGHCLPRIVKKDSTQLHCIQFMYKIDKTDRIVRFLPEMVEGIFQKITDADCRHLGLSPEHCRPEWLICSVVPIPPPNMRPPAHKNSQLPRHDDLTYKLCDVIKANRALAKYIELLRARTEKAERAEDPRPQQQTTQTTNAINCYRRVLQYHVAVLVDNTMQGLPQAQQRTGRPLRCIKSRIKGKEGRVRGNLNGKRVNSSARSVITPDPSLSIDQLGVPQTIAEKLTFPQTVTRFNLHVMIRIVSNGANIYPGCNKIELHRDGRTRIYAMSVMNTQRRYVLANELRIGDIVHRHLVNGDAVLFNRQPSLHKMSMMCHRVRVLPYLTFRLNVNVTSPYNADFDGDEMNMHVPQSVGAAVELNEIASVIQQIISPGTNKPVIVLIQDALLGMSMFTGKDVHIDRNQAMDLLMWCSEFHGFVKQPFNTVSGSISGSTLLTQYMLPFFKKRKYSYPYSTLTRKSSSKVSIKQQGQAFKSALKHIVHATFNDDGPKHTQILLDTTSYVAMRWLLAQGFSVGLGDLLVDKPILSTMSKIRQTAKQNVLNLMCTIHDGTFVNPTSQSNEEHFEQHVLQSLTRSLNEINELVLKDIPLSNRLLRMINAGSKGSAYNLSQMLVMVGQQVIDGQRIAYGFSDRTLPHFHKYDDGIRARGFVSSSYVSGLEPTEFFFHAIAGREGLIDTAVKTAETGYIQRRMVKAMEDLVVAEDGTVRNSRGRIVQMHYGGDGFDVTKLETYRVPDWFFQDTKQWGVDSSSRLYRHLIQIRQTLGVLINDDQRMYVPIALGRWLCTIVRNTSDASSTKVVAATDADIVHMGIALWNEIRRVGTTQLWLHDIHNNKSLDAAIHLFFTPREVHQCVQHTKHTLTLDHLRRLCNKTMTHLAQARVMPGETVGIIGAQSLGEPATQMTLNTFHAAGISEQSNVIRGVPRLKEILRVTKNMRSPSMIVVPSTDSHVRDSVERLRYSIVQTKLADILAYSEIVYEPKDAHTLPDMQYLGVYNILMAQLQAQMTSSPLVRHTARWVLCFSFDSYRMLQHQITMRHVYHSIMEKLRASYDTTNMAVTYQDDNVSGYIALRIMIVLDTSDDDDDSTDPDEDIDPDSDPEDDLDDGSDPEDDEDILMILQKIERDLVRHVSIGGLLHVRGGTIREIKLVLNSQRARARHDSNSANKYYVIDTQGSNISSILSQPGVDARRTTSNDIQQMLSVLGIEAARNTIIREFQAVVQNAKTYVNEHHIRLLADTMTYRGRLMSVDRFGINKNVDNSIIGRASFEMTAETLLRASVFGESDNMLGVSANVMFGQPTHLGTGMTEVIVKEAATTRARTTMQAQQYTPGHWATVTIPHLTT